MIVNGENLRTLGVAFKANFQAGLGMHASQWSQIATEVPSTTASNDYGWLGQFPSMRKWLGDRVVNRASAHKYAIDNEDYELTVSVRKTHIQDDNIGIYKPMFEEMGRATAAHPDEDIFGLLARGWDTECYDGQAFFDADHPRLNAAGETVTVSNSGGGSGAPWFLMDVSRALKPLIYQTRQAAQFVAMDKLDDENVFMRKEFIYGVDCRDAVGFGFWQMAYGSKQELTAANYKAARTALEGQLGDYDRPLGLQATLLVVPPSLEGAALEILNAERNAAGATNIWRGTAQMLKSPWIR
ncbi:Mu-like prophage major head subunit gpT family protein [Pannonibacter phragmitetus]|uniref:Mu-like prophage major head subunit gpT family protein n=1 Tax=Pannonibacter phragmitetus TaxID=121719 RepID=UPI000B977E7A|nr:Mu-like prophage major head subunit gpT family protein [Pannonibacter phragmitetus]